MSNVGKATLADAVGTGFGADVVAGTATSVPAAELVRRHLVQEISTGRLPVGAKVGSERQLAAQLGVSRAVVRQVLAGLADAGLVRRVTGRSGGTFVWQRKLDRNPFELGSLPASLESLGIPVEIRVLSAVERPANSAESLALGLPTGAQIIALSRVWVAGNSPLSLERTILPSERFGDLLLDGVDGVLLEILARRYGVQPHSYSEQLEVMMATVEESVVLNVPNGAPLLSVTRRTCDHTGLIFEYAHELLRADRVSVIVNSSDGADEAG